MSVSLACVSLSEDSKEEEGESGEEAAEAMTTPPTTPTGVEMWEQRRRRFGRARDGGATTVVLAELLLQTMEHIAA
jgi:hypothetical protein